MENITIVVVKPKSPVESITQCNVPVNSLKYTGQLQSINSGNTHSATSLIAKPLSMKKNENLGKCDEKTPTLGVKFVSAGIAACAADMVTFPLDTAKVRLQIQGEGTGLLAGAHSSASLARSAAPHRAAAAATLQYHGIVGTLCTIARKEGVRAWYQGLSAGLQRQMCFASVRIGLYDVVKGKYTQLFSANPENKNIGIRILAGLTTGSMAVLCAQPTDVVKTRLQAQTVGKKRYNGAIHAYRTIATTEGVAGLWKGVAPNVARNSIVNVTELVSYDLIKEFILHRRLLSDNMPCHFISAVGAGVCTTVLASPVDVVKTRFMNSSPGTYRGAIHCATQMYSTEGCKAFYKGCLPSFMRLTCWSILMFVTFEQVKRGITSLKDKNKYKVVEKVRPRMVNNLPSLEDVLDSNSSSIYV